MIENNLFKTERGNSMSISKYQGVIPAFYACYNEDGSVSVENTKVFAKHLLDKGVKGLYVNGSSGECIYQSVAEKKLILENVMEAVGGKMTIIAHVACNNTADSCELAAHAEQLGVDAIASIPPIYFRLPEKAIAKYWNDISDAAPNTDFIIYNIPQLAGVSLTMSLLKEMLKNPRVRGVKNSSMPVQDIQMFKAEGGPECAVFNGPDEQFISGLAMGADGGIGGTYAVMPELFLALKDKFDAGNIAKAREIQNNVDSIIYAMCACEGNLYAVMKAILKINEGLDLGSVRAPLAPIVDEDKEQVVKCSKMIKDAIAAL